MLKKIAIFVPLSILMAATVWVFASGSANDPLVSITYLLGTFYETVEAQVDKKLDASDAALMDSLAVETEQQPAFSGAANWTETRLKRGDILGGRTGTNVLLLAGGAQVNYDDGAVVDVTTGSVVENGAALIADHRYIVAEDTSAIFIVTTKTAVLNYQGEYGFAYSNTTDYNAMAAALKSLHLFKGSFTGYGQGFDLELAPTRLQALIMFIRVLGEEEEALAWNGTQPFLDIHEGTQAFHYVGYAYEKGYTNGYTTTEFRPAGAVNAWQYTEFMLRAMGYSSAANTNIGDALTRAQEAGMLTQGEASYLQADTFLRAELVYISYYALQTHMPDSSLLLADQLQMKGIFSPGEWSAALAAVPGQRM